MSKLLLPGPFLARVRFPGCPECWRAGLPDKRGQSHPPCSNPNLNHAGIWQEGSPGGKPLTLPKAPSTVGDAFFKSLKALGV